MSGAHRVLRGIDRAAFAVSFVQRLRRAGLRVDMTAGADLAEALGAMTPADSDELYWMLRITVLRRHADLATFDAVFAAVFADAVLPMDPAARRRPLPTTGRGDRYAPMPAAEAEPQTGTGLPWTTLPAVVGPADRADDAPAVPMRLPTDVATLADTGFEDLDGARMAHLERWLARATRPARRSRRLTIGRPEYRIALRPTISRARRTGFEIVRPVAVTPQRRPRRVVVICDVSRSMEAQAHAYLHLMRALVRTWGAEAFVFATGLTRLTPALANRLPAAATAAATAAVADRFGGTRIAANLSELVGGRHGRLLRGAVVVIGSDGWDSDPPADLARVMRRIRRRAHRVIWMNPRAGATGFEPLVKTMAAALPYCDDFLAVDTFAAFERVIDAIARPDLTPRLPARSPRGKAENVVIGAPVSSTT